MSETDFQAIWIPEARKEIAHHLTLAKRSRDITKPDGWYRKQYEPVIAALEAALAAFDASIAEHAMPAGLSGQRQGERMNTEREDVRRYLDTLRRIPAVVRQSMATRAFNLDDPDTCVCGWAIRDALMASAGIEGPVDYTEWRVAAKIGTAQSCQREFGGTLDEWTEIFDGVCYPPTARTIETAFTVAVSETVRATRRKSRTKLRRREAGR